MIKSYLITDPLLFGDTPRTLKASLTAAVEKHSPDFVCLRDKNAKNYEALAREVMKIDEEFRLLIHSDVDLAIKLDVFGVHLSSSQFHEIARAKKAGLFVIASTHSYEEALAAMEADAITYSPIFFSPNKGIPKGLEDLKEITGKINTKIFALGGILSSEQIRQVETCGVYGFASIRYFLN
jgi:thiamine-phosphate pyrophosphorylase